MTDTVIHASHEDNIDSKPYALDWLPNTLAGLLATAIGDARQLDRNTYHPTSVRWHWPSEQGQCHVCLAGSILARAFPSSPHRFLMPWMFSLDTDRKLYAINHVRCGRWLDAYEMLHALPTPRKIGRQLRSLPNPSSPDYEGWNQFHAHLDSLESIIPRLREIEQQDRRLSSVIDR